jgi:hypothetical protein
VAGVLLRSGNIKNYKPLGEEGTPVYKSANQLRSAIQRHLDADSAKVLAIPQANEDGDVIDWYASEPGVVVPWSAATIEERRSAKEELAKIQRHLAETGAKMQNTNDRERRVFGRLLEHVIQFPDEQHVYLVNGKPVLTFWGFVTPDSSDDKDCLGLLSLTPASPVAEPVLEPIPVIPTPVTTDGVLTRRRFNLWWWLLLIPLLLALMFYLLRGCDTVQPLLVEMGLKEPEVIHTEGNREVLKKDVDERHSSREWTGTRDGVSVYGRTDGSSDTTVSGRNDTLGVRGEGTGESETSGQLPDDRPVGEDGQNLGQAEEDLDDGLTPDDQPLLDTPEENQPPQDSTSEQQPPEDQLPDDTQSKDQPPQDDLREPQESDTAERENVSDPSRSKEDSGEPLKIPDNAQKTGSTEFLDGEWKASSGLVDSATGKPLDLQYEFKGGKGKVKIQQSDGSVCTGPVTAQMKGEELNFSGAGTIKCPGGKTYKPATVRCNPNRSGTADCEGKYSSGETFGLEINKAKP